MNVLDNRWHLLCNFDSDQYFVTSMLGGVICCPFTWRASLASTALGLEMYPRSCHAL